ncbi:hypothetical protein [Chitiniphilus eburneus]|uniref:hypothetical protein n=1 Tax=Chitiniphilus eburneus TaxID=2571148 RepID=UPI0035CF079E
MSAKTIITGVVVGVAAMLVYDWIKRRNAGAATASDAAPAGWDNPSSPPGWPAEWQAWNVPRTISL